MGGCVHWNSVQRASSALLFHELCAGFTDEPKSRLLTSPFNIFVMDRYDSKSLKLAAEASYTAPAVPAQAVLTAGEREDGTAEAEGDEVRYLLLLSSHAQNHGE